MTSPSLLAFGGKGEAEPVGYSQHASAHHDALPLSWHSEARVRPNRSATVSMQVLTMAPALPQPCTPLPTPPPPPGENKPVGYIYFRIFRMIRVLRMMRAIKYWPGLLRIFMCLLGAARQVANISLDLPGSLC
jgi:hypothetical protein